MDTKNQLLPLLSSEDRALIMPHLERVTLSQRQTLYQPLEPITHAHFFEGGLSSEVLTDSEGERIEVGCTGREGVSGIPLLLGVECSRHLGFMEVGGPALRIEAGNLRSLLEQSATLRGLLLRYAHTFMVQVAATVLADGRYEIHQRLARWLLMAHDRLGQDNLPLTHEFLALMLGVRRSGVTNAIHILEGDRIVKAERGLITVRDRPQLEKIAGGSYGLAEDEYRRILRPASSTP